MKNKFMARPVGRYFKVVVSFERRPDGGLRAWSDDVPGFILSHHDASAVLADVTAALDTILSERFGEDVVTEPRLFFVSLLV